MKNTSVDTCSCCRFAMLWSVSQPFLVVRHCSFLYLVLLALFQTRHVLACEKLVFAFHLPPYIIYGIIFQPFSFLLPLPVCGVMTPMLLFRKTPGTSSYFDFFSSSVVIEGIILSAFLLVATVWMHINNISFQWPGMMPWFMVGREKHRKNLNTSVCCSFFTWK